MNHVYAAVLRSDTLEWTGERPSELERSKPIPVHVLLREETTKIAEEERQRLLKAALEDLARNQTPESVQSWLEYMQDMRKDKPLYGREED